MADQAIRDASHRLASALVELFDAHSAVITETINKRSKPVVIEQKPQPLLVDRAGAADALGVSVSTVDELVKDKKLNPIYIGRLPRFDVVDLRRFIEQLKSEQIVPGVVPTVPESEVSRGQCTCAGRGRAT
ncbi:MAG TPA: helix-turn-helix domain-containing protein [Tepidisphaeraceae bacterium]|jgi:excisionase family DNA binding protein